MNIKYRPDIDGLRAIAVLSVIAYHLNSRWLHGGFIGVDIFFVISGYLITKIIYTDIVNNQFSFKVFYQRRINRILPTFFIVMLATSIGAWYVLLPDEFMLYLRSLKSTTYFWENMFFAKNTGGYWDIAAEKMPILHTWSLAVEEQFYILLPFVLLFVCGIQFKTKRKLLTFNKTSLLIVLAVIAFASFYVSQISFRSSFLTKYNYYSLFTARAGELLIGSIIGIISVTSNKSNELNKRRLWINNIVSLIGFLAMILSIIFISKNSLFPSFIALIPTIGAALIIYFYDSRTYIARFLSLKPVVFIGKISFSMYLWHWPLIVLTKQYLFLDNFDATWQYLFLISLTFILSVFTYLLVETPCRKYKKSFKFSFILYYLIPVIAIIGIYKLQEKTKFLDFRYEERLSLYDLQKQYLNPENEFCDQKIIGSCIFGDKSKKPNIFMFGDSHAGHYSPYIDEAGKRYGFAVKIINAHACEFNENQIKEKLIGNDFKPYCEKSMEYVNKEINKYKVIILAFRNDKKGLPKDGKNNYLINDTLLKLTNKYKDKKFVILGQVPVINNNIHDKFMYYFTHGRTLRKAPFLNGNEKDANNSVKRTAKSIAAYFEPLNYLDDDSKQNWPIYKGLIAYSYDSHLGEYVTRQWSQEVLPKQKEFWENISKIANEK